MSVGRYRLVKQIGRGGMAEVVEAVAVGDHGFERKVAIKRLLATTGEQAERYRRMFLDEARIAAQLHHANIVAVIDFGIGDGMPFQVLEHVDGIDLHSLIKRANGRRLPIPLALYICVMVGHALEYAHAVEDADGNPLGIVHRDVTPGNILVAWTGDIKLTDFGIAFAHERAERTMAGTTKGTPMYMAPEQMLGEQMDRRTDLFSLGCVLHTMVVGHSPLSSGDQRFQVAAGEEIELDATLPAELRAIIERATRHDRRDRYANAGELVAALASALATYAVADSRSALRDWLRELRGSAPVIAASPPARGKLDALLDLDLVLADASGGVRSFHSFAAVTRVERPGPTTDSVPTTPSVGAPPPAPHEDTARLSVQPDATVRDPVRRVASSKSRWPIVAVGTGLGIVVVVAVLVTWFASEGTPRAEPGVVVAMQSDAAPLPPPLANAPVDAAVVVEVDVGVPSDAALGDAGTRPRATPSGQLPATVTPRDDREIERWIEHHGRASRAFDAWKAAHVDAARALYDWDTKTGGSGALVSWLNASSDATISDYLAAKRQPALAALVARDPEAFSELAAWAHAWRKQLRGLIRLGVGLPWTSRP